jgi:adenine-specific DNA glycosylase
MTGAIEFLRKAKAICNNTHPCADECPLNDWCHHEDDMNEADLVRKVMAYQIKEVSDEC